MAASRDAEKKTPAPATTNYYAQSQNKTSQEMGDIWMYGLQSDIKKAQLSRAYMRAVDEYLRARPAGSSVLGADDQEGREFDDFAKLFLTAPEHNFGISTCTVMNAGDRSSDFWAWTNDAFAKVRGNAGPLAVEASWVEKRDLSSTKALEKLGAAHPLRARIQTELGAIEALETQVSHFAVKSTS